MPNPDPAHASTDKKSAGFAKRNRLLTFFRGGAAAPAAARPAAAVAGQAAPARPASPPVWTQRSKATIDDKGFVDIQLLGLLRRCLTDMRAQLSEAVAA